MNRLFKVAVAGGTIALALSALPANAALILCESTARNHMYVDSQYVSSCVDAGTGNINGNPLTDDFLLQNPGLDYAGLGAGTFTKSGTSGTFGLASSLWNDWSSLAIGFKFGTGGKADEWFVYLLNPNVSSGTWSFVNVFNRGGGLSHVQLYGVQAAEVPEPGTLGLLGASVLGLLLFRWRKANRTA